MADRQAVISTCPGLDATGGVGGAGGGVSDLAGGGLGAVCGAICCASDGLYVLMAVMACLQADK